MRMVASSAKSTGRRRAICSGLQAFAHRRSFRGPCRRLCQDTTGPGTGAPLGAAAAPDNRSSTWVLNARVARKLRLLWAASSALGVPLRCRRTIREAAASGGGVAPQLSGDCRCHSPEPASDLLPGVALNAKERDLLPLRTREITTTERLRRSPKHRWRQAPCLPEPSCSYACGTPTPTTTSSLAVPAIIAAQNRRRSSRPAAGDRPGENKRTRPERSERRFRMFIATPVKVLRRPLRSALAAAGRSDAAARPGLPRRQIAINEGVRDELRAHLGLHRPADELVAKAGRSPPRRRASPRPSRHT